MRSGSFVLAGSTHLEPGVGGIAVRGQSAQVAGEALRRPRQEVELEGAVHENAARVAGVAQNPDVVQLGVQSAHKIKATPHKQRHKKLFAQACEEEL